MDKKISFDFFTIRTRGDSQFDFSNILSSVVSGEVARPWRDEENIFRIKTVMLSYGVYYGEFCKYRMNNIPHTGSPSDEDEHEIPLGDSEGLIEKNYFSYIPEDKLIIFQRNGHASRGQKLGNYLTSINNETITLDPVVTGDSLRRLMSNDVTPVKFELSVSRPTNPALFPSNSRLSSDMIAWMNSLGGSGMKLVIRTDRRSNESTRRSLNNQIKEVARAFSSYDDTSVLKVDVERGEGGVVEPIDLIADRISVTEMVRMEGKYPVPQSMYSALHRAFESKRGEVYEVIGTRESRLQ